MLMQRNYKTSKKGGVNQFVFRKTRLKKYERIDFQGQEKSVPSEILENVTENIDFLLAQWPIIQGICAIVREETPLSIGDGLSSHEIPNAC